MKKILNKVGDFFKKAGTTIKMRLIEKKIKKQFKKDLKESETI